MSDRPTIQRENTVRPTKIPRDGVSLQELYNWLESAEYQVVDAADKPYGALKHFEGRQWAYHHMRGKQKYFAILQDYEVASMRLKPIP